MMKNHVKTDGSTPEQPKCESRRPFTAPKISDPVEIVKGNPAANALFAVAGASGGPI